MKRNAGIILKYTTAYPFRLPEGSVVCVYCNESFAESSMFRRHMDAEHEGSFHHDFFRLYRYIKADCTELSCRICSTQYEHLEDAAEHLLLHHNMTYLDLNYSLGIYPFKLEADRYGCSKCTEKFNGLRALSIHIQTHYSDYICETCGKSYPTLSSLKNHIKVSHIVGGLPYCSKCKSTFKTLEAKRKHMAESPKCWHYVCKVCNERFITRYAKRNHLAKEHGIQQNDIICPECGDTFDRSPAYKHHFQVKHTNHIFTCSDCGMKFVTQKRLEEHRVSHTKERLFPCTVCTKSFPRKKNLIQHMWIHSEHKRFECTQCKKQFNQRVSWKTHMKSYHPDFEIIPYQRPSAYDEWKK